MNNNSKKKAATNIAMYAYPIKFIADLISSSGSTISLMAELLYTPKAPLIIASKNDINTSTIKNIVTESK